MPLVKPLPAFLVSRYHGWRATTYEENKAWYRRLANEGQRPRMMVISCCDSRVNVNALFGAQTGDIFLHRNIANLVPPYLPDGDPHGTSAAVEYAVSVLKVSHVIVVGHSDCGGVRGCMDMCEGHMPELEEKSSFIGRWLEILRPGYEEVSKITDEAERIKALERAAVSVSIRNLATFPFVQKAVEDGSLTLHGLRIDIGDGVMESMTGEGWNFAVV
ncbi:carbonic anhydrase [Alphaproteobacteria bacterium KMM 3653]|uniref:Carbonic anhydrase n=1 Tax=Harenicola maris TaxID=2841044 RepID=A0AAP2CNY1_9RHOB|nr:carbonic anhydrase [Harenicola maris]